MINNRRFENIYCDLDGTLLDDRDRHYRCYEDIVKIFGGCCITQEEYWEGKRNKVKRTVLLERTHFGGTYDDYLSSWNSMIETSKYLKYEKLKPDAVKALKWMKKNSNNLILISMRQNRDILIWQLKSLGIIEYFDKIITGDATKGEKKADLIDRSVVANNLIIGDTEAEGELARKINGLWVAITNGIREKRYLEDADFYLENIGEIESLEIGDLQLR